MTRSGAAASVLVGVDRAAFATAFAERLRGAGVMVSMTNVASLTNAMAVCILDTLSRVYWLARTTLVTRHEDLEIFDRVFAAVFDEVSFSLDPQARRTRTGYRISVFLLGETSRPLLTGMPPSGTVEVLGWAELPSLGRRAGPLRPRGNPMDLAVGHAHRVVADKRAAGRDCGHPGIRAGSPRA